MGEARPCPRVIALASSHTLIPVCPEKAGGLDVPRPASEVVGASAPDTLVVDATGRDVTEAFLRGADEAVRIAREHGCRVAVMKAKSPSCGSGGIYDGTFSKTLVVGDGCTARALKIAGIDVVDECAEEALKALEAGTWPPTSV